MIVGIPFPQSNDPRVKLKKDFLNKRLGKIDEFSQTINTISGGQWYQ
jgi:Rad3-related DNA helicase